MELEEDLFHLICFWYGYNTCRIKPQDKLSSVHILTCWSNKWFAKGDLQTKIDETLNEYEPMVEKYLNYEPKNIIESIALIILYDQITRNIFRGKPKAYEFDHIALKLAKNIIQSGNYNSLGLHFKLTVLMAYVHSEDIKIQNLLYSTFVPGIKNEPNLDNNLYSAFQKIAANHRERITLFGRIPERVKIRGGELTCEEKNYVQNLY